ncbi:TIGR03854 family LLM class F420-dependent oxidoreductase [Phaeacidiphilus oryzae]|uniref:TIGR03854 family LLM class F420-dependent oxidoreductase n=1 Tax=Phaeacidiphilus oryzae TaxID=348818 RepID=UPI000AA2CAC8|nr:TIGR03854 family LLM class F420-dependent oxidoreductase [Phaeacidiphilus oryzae]
MAKLKVRFGVGLGASTPAGTLGDVADQAEAAGIDSLWLSEHIHSPAADPFIGMAHVLARTRRLKAGTSVAVLPGRQPTLVAKQLASLAALTPGRVLPVFGLQPARRAERAYFPLPAGVRRGDAFDEALRDLRAALTGGDLGPGSGSGPGKPLDLWLGGSAPAGLRRVGRHGDGWLGSFLTPPEARAAREAIEESAAEAGRAIDADHYGISLTLADGELPPRLVATARDRRPGADPGRLAAADWPRLHALLDEYIDAGLSKFVVYYAGTRPFPEFLARFAEELLPRQN